MAQRTAADSHSGSHGAGYDYVLIVIVRLRLGRVSVHLCPLNDVLKCEGPAHLCGPRRYRATPLRVTILSRLDAQFTFVRGSPGPCPVQQGSFRSYRHDGGTDIFSTRNSLRPGVV